MIARLLFFLTCSAAMAFDDFRPIVAEAIAKGEKKILIPPGTYRLAPSGERKCVWTLQGAKDVEIIADGVTLVSTKLTRAVEISQCTGVTVKGLTVDYDPLPFTQGTVAAVADDKSWIDVKLHAGYPRQSYSRIDVVDPATRYRKKGTPFLWGTKAEMQGDDTVRVTLKGLGNIATVGTLASLNTGPAPYGIPHALSIERCSAVTLRGVTIHSAPGMGILECDGDGKTAYLGCRVVPGPKPDGASEARLLSTSWDAMQSKTIRHGPRVEDCEIREAGDDSWSVQSADFMVLKRTGKTLIIACRDEYTIGMEKGDRLKIKIGGPEATITDLRGLSREQAGLAPEVMEKLTTATNWSEWKVSPKCLEVTLDHELPVDSGSCVYSPDRMGNGFVFLNNRIHSSGRVLIKAAGLIEGNLLDTPHSMVVCPEIPGNAATGIDGLIIRKNTIRHSGWFCAAPWSTQAGALSITAGGAAQKLRAPGIFANVIIEDNIFEDCSGPNLVISSAQGVKVRGNRFIRPHHDKPDETGASYGIANNAVIWTTQCEDMEMVNNPITEPGSFCGEMVVLKQP
jgi:hypothetical protein